MYKLLKDAYAKVKIPNINELKDAINNISNKTDSNAQTNYFKKVDCFDAKYHNSEKPIKPNNNYKIEYTNPEEVTIPPKLETILLEYIDQNSEQYQNGEIHLEEELIKALEIVHYAIINKTKVRKYWINLIYKDAKKSFQNNGHIKKWEDNMKF